MSASASEPVLQTIDETEVSQVEIRPAVVRLLTAAKDNDMATLVEMLSDESNAALLNEGDGRGRTALHFAAHMDHVDVLRVLLQRGADIDKQDHLGHSAIVVAAICESEAALRFLVEQGADLNLVSKVDPCGLLHHAAMHMGVDVVDFLLHAGARMTDVGRVQQDNGSPLFKYASDGNVEMMRKLLDAGSNVNVTDSNGLRPFHAAIVTGQLEMARFLVEAGANVEHRVRGGGTAMHLAAGTGNVEALQWLATLEAAPRLFGFDNDLETPLDVARATSHAACERALLECTIRGETGAAIESRWRTANDMKLRANNLVKEGKYEQALAIYVEATQLAPENFSLFGNRSLCHFNMKRYPRAIEEADESLRINPWWSKGYIRKAAPLIVLKKYDAAADVYRIGRLFNPDDDDLIEAVKQLARYT